MPMDAICLSGVVEELRSSVTGGKIDKIYQPARDEVILVLRTGAGNVRLLFSASPSGPRVQRTDLPRENPAQPPMFCMLLRKHLVGGRILGMKQPSMERLVELDIEVIDELGDRGIKRLILEAMGRRSNIILLDEEGRILDCLRKVDAEMSEQRQLLPGLFYHDPPKQDKLDPSSMTPVDLAVALSGMKDDTPADRWLLDTFQGISPLIARELAFEALGETDAPVGRNPEKLLDRLEKLVEKATAGTWEPYLLLRDGKPADFSFRPILQYGPSTQLKKMDKFSLLLDVFYEEKELSERVRQKGQDLIRSVTTARDRVVRKLGIQAKELESTRERDKLRRMGELITANLYRMGKGMRVLRTTDYYDPEGQEIDIPLDPLKTPQQNAARYYKDYNRAKTAEQMLTEQIVKGKLEQEYLDSVLESLSRAQGERDLNEIRQELVGEGYVRRQAKAKDRMKRPPVKPLEFCSSQGLRISVGRNNTQNDQLTTKLAGRTDIWLHTQKLHGAHVILWTQGQEPDVQSLTEAAMLAAWFSQGRDGQKVPVDFTPVKYVKKPIGARTGMVVYTTYETAYVTPEESLLKTLQV